MNQSYFPEIKTARLFLRRLEQFDWGMVSYLRTAKSVNIIFANKKAGN
jgi:hypothetical protein